MEWMNKKMVNLQLASFAPNSGKSAICLALGRHYLAKGLRVRYMKPVSNMTVVEGRKESWDAAFISEKLGAPVEPELLSPVLVTPENFEELTRIPLQEWVSRVQQAFKTLSQGADLMLIESGMNWVQGYSINFSAKHIARLLDTRVLLVMNYEPYLNIDGAVFARDNLEGRLAGIIVNRVPYGLLEKTRGQIKRVMKQFNIPVVGVLAEDKLLCSISVADLAEVLDGEILQDYEQGYPEPLETNEIESPRTGREHDELVENFSVGAMNVEQALTYFRRIPRKAVITGGDRADIQLAALETDTVALILTGNLYPAPVVQTQAALLHVPIILVAESTMQVVRRIDEVLGPIRIRSESQIEHLQLMVEKEPGLADFSRLLGLPV
jgi:BioD-like phosphotransacetylase family protein